MRLKNTLKNSIVSLLFQLVTLLIGFIVPSLVISTYGSEVNGLTSNITQIISIINLLQAGIVGASIYEMYKPIINNDYETIGRIYYTSRKNFKRLSFYFFVLTFCIIPYLLFGKNSNISTIEIILSVLILGINATFLFRYYCSYDVIFSAYQKKYILIFSSIIEKIVYYILLFVGIYYHFHFLFMYISVLIGSILRIIYLTIEFNKMYKSDIVQYKNFPLITIPNQRKLFGNQIIQNVIESSPTLMVTSLYGLTYASIISIYMMIINVFKMIFSTLQNSIAASFGDLIASNDQKKVLSIFNVIQYLFTSLSIIFYVCLICLLLPFIKIYCKDISNINYVYISLALSLLFYIISYTSFLPFNMIINSAGYYGKVLKTNFVLFIFTILFALICCYFNFSFVYFGTGLFYLIASLHRYILLIENGFYLNKKNIFRVFIVYIIVATFTPLIGYFYNSVYSWTNWFVSAVFICFCSLFIFVLYTVLFERKEFTTLLKYIHLKK